MGTDPIKLVQGGAFLIESSTPDDIFTPEDFTQEHRMIVETTRAFVDGEIRPNADTLEHQDWDLTVRLLHKAGELGLLAADVPEEYDGLGADKVTSALISENISRGGSFALSHGAHVGIGTLPIVFFGNEYQKKHYLPKLASGEWISAYALTEPGSGSDALGAKTTAKLTADGQFYVLNGTKQFITNSAFADVFIVYAKIDGEKFSAFIVERGYDGVSTGAEEKKMGIKASSTRSLILEDVQVPVKNLLGEPGRGHVIAFNILNIGRYKLAVGCVGGMKEVIQTTVKYAKSRKQFQTEIANFPLIQQKIADMNLRCYVTESMVYRSTGEIDRRLDAMGGHPDGRTVANAIAEYALECSVNKVYGSEALDFVADEGVQIHGGYGYVQEYYVEHAYRDSRVNRIFEGTNEINRLLIPDMLLRKAFKGELPLLQVAQGLQQELLGMMPMANTTEPLGVEDHILNMARKIFLFVGGTAVQKYMQNLKDEQEILADLADIITEVYALESALLRTKKALASGQEASLKVAMVEVYSREALSRIEGHAKAILAAMEEGDTLRTQLAVLRKLTRVEPINAKTQKRQIAQAVIAAERYLV
ncbi:acyl-CoA dehydrogenase [Alicyclobacillaceae bacterium I2511]|nr:acyl-CoA dehydrogenase [Alicyclobacillaceae bacterium I2511]